MNETREYITTTEAAALLGVTAGRVRQWIVAGRLASIRPGRDRLVRRADVVALQSRRTQPGPVPDPNGARQRRRERQR
jgi:excisionase family DNA binding protein